MRAGYESMRRQCLYAWRNLSSSEANSQSWQERIQKTLELKANLAIE